MLEDINYKIILEDDNFINPDDVYGYFDLSTLYISRHHGNRANSPVHKVYVNKRDINYISIDFNDSLADLHKGEVLNDILLKLPQFIIMNDTKYIDLGFSNNRIETIIYKSIIFIRRDALGLSKDFVRKYNSGQEYIAFKYNDVEENGALLYNFLNMSILLDKQDNISYAYGNYD